jgi:hypothetical protein
MPLKDSVWLSTWTSVYDAVGLHALNSVCNYVTFSVRAAVHSSGRTTDDKAAYSIINNAFRTKVNNYEKD